MRKEILNIASSVFIFVLTLLGAMETNAEQLSPEVSISLLTSGPSDKAIFTAWGHTAIRVKDPMMGTDYVYNYGIFHFGNDFIPRFVSGQTDYRLGVSNMFHVFEEVEYKNCDLIEQELNLTQKEKERLVEALEENYKPENRYYRYKFFGDNCATRPRHIIAESIDGTVSYPSTGDDSTTYRDYIYDLLKTSPWFILGIDLCLGTPTDKVVTDQERLFLPAELCKTYNGAQIVKADTIIPIVKETRLLYEKQAKAGETIEGTSLPGPTTVFGVLLLLIVAHIIFYTYTQKDDRWFHLIYFGLVGLIGVVLTFVSWISVHEFVFPNWNILLLNPLQLAIAVLIYTKKVGIRTRLYQIVLGLTLLYILVDIADITGQHFNDATFAIAIIQSLLCWEYLLKAQKKDLA